MPFTAVPLTPGLVHDLPAMAAAVTPQTRVMFVANPNNPTGTLASRDELLRFIERVPPGVLLALDEAYIEFLEEPLDAVLALGRLGDKRAVDTLAGLQRTAPRHIQPSIAAAICLVGVNCGSHEGYLTESLAFSITNTGYQELLRGAASGTRAGGVLDWRCAAHRGHRDGDRRG